MGGWAPEFDDPGLERAYAADHARRSVLPIRVMALTLGAASLALAAIVGPVASLIGLDPMSAIHPAYGVLNVLVSMFAMGTLLLRVGHPRVLPRQQRFVGVLLSVLLLCDVPQIARFPLAYGLTANLVQIMTAYVLLRLRFRTAVTVGGATSAAYLLATSPLASTPAFAFNAGFLVVANVILAAACHQLEQLDRVAFLGRHRLEQRSKALEEALRQLEQAQTELLERERQAAIGRVAAGLLHELNTPLGVLRSSADTIARTLERAVPSPGEADRTSPGRVARAARAAVDAQGTAVARMGQVVEGLARFVDLDREGPRPVDVRVGLRDALLLLAPRLSGVAVQDALPDEPMWVVCHPARLNQAFFGVLENAAQALMGAGHIEVRAEREAGHWVVVVEDDGPGMPPALRASAFEPGFSSDGARVKMRLGLPTARHAVEACGGRIDLSAGAAGGTRVRFELPAARSLEP